MSQILMVHFGLEWFRQANKYLENLVRFHTSKYGTVTVQRKYDDEFIDEFDFIIKNMGL